MTLLSASKEGEVYIQNKYLDIGINSGGTIGTKKGGAPEGFYTDAAHGYLRVGIYADLDGFGVGAQTKMGDVTLRGTPTEGFGISFSSGAQQYTKINAMGGRTDFVGSTKNLSDQSVNKVGYTGQSAEKLAVNQVMTMTDDAKFVKVEVTLTNNSSSTMSDLQYRRALDPDHGTARAKGRDDATFSTNNKVISQGPTSGEALVVAYGDKTSNPLFFYTDDDRAVAGFSTYDKPFVMASGNKAVAEGTTMNGDYTLNLTFGLGSLGAGQSTTITYYMGLTDNLGTTLAQIKSGLGAPTTPPVPVNHAPNAMDDLASTIATQAITGNVLANDTDSDKNSLTTTMVTGPKNGTVTLDANGNYAYTAKAGFVGTDSFTYKASDGKLSDEAVVKITVAAPPNNAPVANDDAAAVISGKTVNGNVLANDTDADKNSLSATLVTGAKNGIVTLDANGNYAYTAKAGFVGTDSFTYKASDGTVSDNATVTLTVAAPPNAAPVAVNDSAAIISGKTVSGNVLANDTDADKNSLSATLVSGPKNGVLTLDTDGNYAYTAKAGFVGTDSFVYKASDGLATDNATVTLTVEAAPVPKPVFIDGSSTASQKLMGTAGHDVFLFDNSGANAVGKDTITNFGEHDLLLMTHAIRDSNGDGIINFKSPMKIHDEFDKTIGSVKITNTEGKVVKSLEFDGTVLHEGNVYYAYSLPGSAADATYL